MDAFRSSRMTQYKVFTFVPEEVCMTIAQESSTTNSLQSNLFIRMVTEVEKDIKYTFPNWYLVVYKIPNIKVKAEMISEMLSMIFNISGDFLWHFSINSGIQIHILLPSGLYETSELKRQYRYNQQGMESEC